MNLTLNYTSDSEDIKSQTSEGEVILSLGYDNNPYDLHDLDGDLIVKIGNSGGYIQDIDVNISNEDDDQKYRGVFSIPLSHPNIQNLPPDVYYLEAWINSHDTQGNKTQLIFPSKGTLPLTITSNIVDSSNEMPMTDFNLVQNEWDQFKGIVTKHEAETEKLINEYQTLANVSQGKDDVTSQVTSSVNRYYNISSNNDKSMSSIADRISNENASVSSVDTRLNSMMSSVASEFLSDTTANPANASDVNILKNEIADLQSTNSTLLSRINTAKSNISDLSNHVSNTDEALKNNQNISNSLFDKAYNASSGVSILNNEVSNMSSDASDSLASTSTSLVNLTSNTDSQLVSVNNNLSNVASTTLSTTNSLYNKASTASGNVSNINSQLSDITTNIDVNKDAINILQSKSDTTDSNVQGSFRDTNNNVSIIGSQLFNASNSIANLNNQLVSTANSFNDELFNDSNSPTNDDVEALKSNVHTELNEIRSNNDNLSKQVYNAENSLSSYAGNLNNTNSTVLQDESSIDSLNNRISGFNVPDLEAQLSRVHSATANTVSSFDDEVAKTESSLSNTNDQLATISLAATNSPNGQIASIATDTQYLNNHVSSLDSNAATTNSRITDLVMSIDSLANRFTHSKKEEKGIQKIYDVEDQVKNSTINLTPTEHWNSSSVWGGPIGNIDMDPYKQYYFSFHVSSITNNSHLLLRLNGDTYINRNNPVGLGGTFVGSFMPSQTMNNVQINILNIDNPSNFTVDKICVTQNSEYLPFEDVLDNEKITDLFNSINVTPAQCFSPLMYQDFTKDPTLLNQWTVRNESSKNTAGAGDRGEVEAYKSKNVTQSPEGIQITANKTDGSQGYDYESGSLFNPFAIFHYGEYAEATIKLPYSTQGMSFAFWFWNKQDVGRTEIDLDEYQTTPWSSPIPEFSIHINNGLDEAIDQPVDPTFANQPHTFGVDWENDYMVYYLDGKAMKYLPNSLEHRDMYPVINLACFKNNGAYGTVPDNELPLTAYVKSFRIYKRPDQN